MKKIRNGVFETNSSSSHSVSINSSEELLDTLIPDKDGNIVLSGIGGCGEFGWGLERINSAYIKALYCAVDCFRNEKSMKLLTDVIKKQTLCNDVIYDIELKDYNSEKWCYIDHQSQGTSSPCFESEENLRNFIFNKNSWLFLANDNSEIPNWFYIESENIEKHNITLISENQENNIDVLSYGEITKQNLILSLADVFYNSDTKSFSMKPKYEFEWEELISGSLYELKSFDIENKELIFNITEEEYLAHERFLNKLKNDETLLKRVKEEKNKTKFIREEVELMRLEPNHIKKIKFVVND